MAVLSSLMWVTHVAHLNDVSSVMTSVYDAGRMLTVVFLSSMMWMTHVTHIDDHRSVMSDDVGWVFMIYVGESGDVV